MYHLRFWMHFLEYNESYGLSPLGDPLYGRTQLRSVISGGNFLSEIGVWPESVVIKTNDD